MKIYLWRHGQAESQARNGKDQDRKLTVEGSFALVPLAKAVKERGGANVIYTSPYLRARQTAGIVQEVLQCADGFKTLPELASGVSTPTQIEALKRAVQNQSSAVFVGHMPDFSHLLQWLLNGAAGVDTGFRAGEVVEVAIENLSDPCAGKVTFRAAP